jgi:tripartite-type tricarboxylate transporter receptor subunit TctC
MKLLHRQFLHLAAGAAALPGVTCIATAQTYPIGLAYPDLLAGHVQVMFDTTPGSIEYIRAGKLRPLAVTTATRSEAPPASR